MGTALSIILVSALFAGAGVLILAVRVHRRFVRPLTIGALFVFAALSIYHTGGFGVADPAWLKGRGFGAGSRAAQDQCEQLVRVLEKSHALSEVRSRKDAIAVNPQLWSQLPPAAQEVTKGCIARSKGIDAASLVVIESADAGQ